MNSRERVLTTINHEEPDRIPCDLGSTRVTGITKDAYINYVEYLGEELGNIKLYDVIQQLVEIPEELLTKLGVDIRGLSPNVARKYPSIKEADNAFFFKDEWGVSWKMPKKAGLYFDLHKSPLSGEVTEENINEYSWPDPTREKLFRGLVDKAKEYYDNGFSIILESFGAGVFEEACRLRGYEEFYMDLVRSPGLACTLMDNILDLKLRFYEVAAKKLGPYIQFIREGDDVGGQDELLISPSAYRNYLKPRHKKLFTAQKEIFPEPFYVFLHSDGAIYEILPDFLESGVEILNPLQVSARGMDLKKIKQEFEDEFVFWGGGIDTQETLPNGIAEKVREEVGGRAMTLASGGGYIFGTVHNIQGDVPPENIDALFSSFNEVKHY